MIRNNNIQFGNQVKIQAEQFLELAKTNPILDVRTPAEFEIGHIPGAKNFPLFGNEERKMIGTAYKKQGHSKAVLMGLDFVKDRMTSMVKEAMTYTYNDAVLLHCWRGGMRSDSVSWLLKSARIATHTLSGGYKSFRNFALDFFEQKLHLIVLSGPTGAGKTEILQKLKSKGEQVIDLENLAQHKGSVFGGIGKEQQPSSEHFQNLLFQEVRNFDLTKRVWIEDENPVIGRVAVPEGLWKQMVIAPRVRILVNKKTRIQRLINDYGNQDISKLSDGITRLEKRLGNKLMNGALTALKLGNLGETAEILLTYYDKAYMNSFEKKKNTHWMSIEPNEFNLNSITEEILAKANPKTSEANYDG